MAVKSLSQPQAMFRYKTNKGILHSLPAIFKLFMFIIICAFFMSFPPLWLIAGIICTAVLAFFCSFTLREMLTDLKPAAFYALLMYALSVFTGLYDNWILPLPALSAKVLPPRPEFIITSLRLVIIVQLSSLLFRTTSAIELTEALIHMEKLLRKSISHLPLLNKCVSLQCRFAQNVSLFLCFIPEIFLTWTMINLAWKARCGRQGIGKIVPIVYLLISLSMEKASLKAKALAARS